MECQTPGAVYRIDIQPERVTCAIALPVSAALNARQAATLDNDLHDALEPVLARLFSEGGHL